MPASAEPWRRCGLLRPQAARSRDALDTLEPTLAIPLLSAQEAKDRLREIVEGFFFRRLRGEGGKGGGRLLVKSPPGLCKTREAIPWAICYQAEQEGKDGTRLLLGDFNEAGVPAQTSIFVPRHQLAEELREVIEGAFRERGEQVRTPRLGAFSADTWTGVALYTPHF